MSLFVLLLAALWFRYRTTFHNFATQIPPKRHSSRGGDGQNIPPTFPYFFPILGTLPLAYLWRPRDLVLSVNSFFQSPQQAIRVKILHQDFYLVRGADNIRALFKAQVTNIPFVKFALSYAFGTPAKALTLYDQDDSGTNHAPHPESTVLPHNRIDYLVHHSTKTFLEGPGLTPLWNRYLKNITAQLHTLHDNLGSSEEWKFHHDLISLISNETTIATLNALCGPHLLRLNPNFINHFDRFDENLQTYMQGFPWFLAPRAYLARKRVLNAVKEWQQHARDHFTPSALDENGDDQYWGSSYFRLRHSMFLAMGEGNFDHASIASSDFGFIWAMRNAITATSWTIYQIFRDPELLNAIRAEVDACSSGGRLEYDTDKLLRCCPVLSAVYAETLRLRTHFYFVRLGDRGNPLPILSWIIPPRKPVVALTTVAHFDKEAWNVGGKGEYPLHVFWPGRFLKPGEKKGEAEFVTKGLEGSWIPYGGGSRMCPGRHFAKRQILVTAALVVGMFDVEVVEDTVGENLTLMGFGSGVSRLVGRAGVKIRRRKREEY
ncbi:cytochrome P450 [Cladorrhinum sp. PSN332]|nr:cytochrome P450 [Cladorrhinum sp. PSN332]